MLFDRSLRTKVCLLLFFITCKNIRNNETIYLVVSNDFNFFNYQMILIIKFLSF